MLQEFNTGMFSGAMAGLVGSMGLFVLRRWYWPGAVALGWVALLMLASGGLLAVGVILRSGASGGDGFIAAATFAIFLVAGVGGGSLFAVLLGGLTHRRFDRPFSLSALTGLLDPMILGLAIWGYTLTVTQPIAKANTDSWWKQESARRERAKELVEAIPPKYREMSPMELDQTLRLNRWYKERGLPEPRPIPQSAVNAMRNRWNAQATPMPAADMSGYHRAEQMKRGFIFGIFGAWLLGAFGAPFAFPRRQAEEPPNRRDD